VFAETIRSEGSHFKADSSWWLVKHTAYYRDELPYAITKHEELSMSNDDMQRCLNARGATNMGHILFSSSTPRKN